MTVKYKILDKAIEIASLMVGTKYNLCAIITDKRNNVLSMGTNSFSKSSPFQKKYAEKLGEPYKIFNHAEIDAIKKLPYDCKPYNIYIARVNTNGQSLLAKPCSICSLAIKELNIKNIYYTK